MLRIIEGFTQRAYTMTLSEMDMQGTSTRKMKELTEQFCGFEIFAETVSRATA